MNFLTFHKTLPFFVFALIVAFTFSFFSSEITKPAEAKSSKTVVEDQDRFLKNSLVGHKNEMFFAFDNVSGKTVRLQRYENSEWVNIAEHSFTNSQKGRQIISWNVQAPSQEGYFTYRLIDNVSLNQDFSLYNTDPKNYDDYTKIAYDSIEEYCGNALILTNDNRINERSTPSKRTMGIAFGYENTFSIRPGLEKSQVQWVARHECGHILQYRAYDADRENSTEYFTNRLNQDLSPYHKNQNNTPTEKDADCIAFYLSEDWESFYSDCYGMRGQAAYNIIHGKTALTHKIDDVFADNIMLENSGFAIDEAKCFKKVKCVQDFENGQAVWNGKDDSYEFVPNDKSNNDSDTQYFAKSFKDALGN